MRAVCHQAAVLVFEVTPPHLSPPPGGLLLLRHLAVIHMCVL